MRCEEKVGCLSIWHSYIFNSVGTFPSSIFWIKILQQQSEDTDLFILKSPSPWILPLDFYFSYTSERSQHSARNNLSHTLQKFTSETLRWTGMQSLQPLRLVCDFFLDWTFQLLWKGEIHFPLQTGSYSSVILPTLVCGWKTRNMAVNIYTWASESFSLFKNTFCIVHAHESSLPESFELGCLKFDT